MRLSCLLTLACLASSCSKDLPATDRVQHLDLELADGASSAKTLASGKLRWVEQLEIAGPGSDLGAWSTHFCRVDPALDGGPGIALVGNVPEVTRMRRVELRCSKTFAASEIDFVELELAHTSSGLASVSWHSSIDLADAASIPRLTTTLVPFTQGPVKIQIPLAIQPGWAGEISDLSIAPKEDGVQRVEVLGVRLGRIGFTPGPDPLDNGEGKDGGLIALGREMRRAWPSDWNVPLFARAKVPRDGRLCVDVGVSTNSTNVTAEVRFRVDARTDEAASWQSIGTTSIVPGMRAQGPAWEHLTISLKAFEGREVRLRFLADERGEPHEGGVLDRARLYWGEPLIEGALVPDSRPNVVLITLDTVRAGAIGAIGARTGASPTPFIDSLAARGVVFENAWTACNATSPSHASLMTGLAVQDHGLVDNRSVLGPANSTIAESFRAAGWETAAAVSVAHLNPAKSGLGQGFDRFLRAVPETADDGANTISGAKEWLRGFDREGARPTFLWVHLFDAHAPYDVPQPFLEDYARRMGVRFPPKRVNPPTLPHNRFSEPGMFMAGVTNIEWADFIYQACVAYDDELLRQLFTEMQQRGGLNNTWIAIVADHGEALGEHDNFFHHSGLYREVMHVPMILVPPPNSSGPRGVRVKEPVWTLDLARTLFGLSGQPIRPEVRGTDLLDFVSLPDRPVRRLFFEHSNLEQVGCCDEKRSAIYTVVDYGQFGPDRKIKAGSLELYDSKADAAQLHDLANKSPDVDARYRELFAAWRSHALNRSTLRGESTPEEEEVLKQLGY